MILLIKSLVQIQDDKGKVQVAFSYDIKTVSETAFHPEIFCPANNIYGKTRLPIEVGIFQDAAIYIFLALVQSGALK